MRSTLAAVGILLLPLLPGAVAAYAQQVSSDPDAVSGLFTEWLSTLLVTIGTPAALVAAVVAAFRWACSAVQTGHPMEFRFRIGNRELFFQLIKIDPDSPPTPVGDEDSEDSEPAPIAA